MLDAAAGLTRYEAEGAFFLSLVRHGKVTAEAVWELKSQMLKKSGLLSLHRGTESFANLGGLEAMKSFCLRAIRSQGHRNPLRRPGVLLLLGVPGTGKSAFAKALGTETGRPTLILDIGSLMGSLVGQTEQNIRQALKIADAMAPCILFLDEVEKALSGANGTGDSGVSARLFGTFLTWLNDHDSPMSSSWPPATTSAAFHRNSLGRNASMGCSSWTYPVNSRSRRSGICTWKCSVWKPIKPGPMTTNGPERKSARVADWLPCWMFP